MSELTLYVAGMGCRRCVREVTARLRDVTGVETVAADARRSQLRLSGSMTFPDITCALDGTTYRAELVHETKQATSPPKVRQDPAEGVVKNRRGTESGQDIP